MRRVTGNTPFNFDGGMFEYERAALLYVALSAGLPSVLPQCPAVGCAVRAVTIRAFHVALWDPVVRGQCELRLNVPVTAIAEIRLRCLQQTAA